jgi:hypothetical protein
MRLEGNTYLKTGSSNSTTGAITHVELQRLTVTKVVRPT